MKKVLLTLAAVAMAFTVGAAETTLEVKDATDIKGTDVPERPAGTNGDKDKGQARHFQPLESLKLGDYSFSFSQGTNEKNAPAYYYSMSTADKQVCTVRLYANNTMTITAPEGKEFGQVTGYEDSKAITIYSGDKVATCNYTATATAKIDKFVFSDEAGSVTPPVTGDVAVKKATAFEAGEVAFVFNEGYVETFSSDKTYGYWIAVATTPADEMKVSNEAIFTIESTDKGYTIKDSFGRFMGWNGKNWSFNAYTSADEGNSYWDAAMVDGKVKITNKAQSSDGNEVYLCGKTYNSDYEMVPTDRADQTLPMLYVKGGEGSVAGIVADNAPAVYYNLQGVRVENPTKGLYIVVKGNKSTKVVF